MVLRFSLFCSLILSIFFSPLISANSSLDPLQKARLSMYRAAVSMISHRGERIDEALETETLEHIQILTEVLASNQSKDVHEALKSYLSLISEGLSYDIQSEDYDRDFNVKFSQSLRELDTQIRLVQNKTVKPDGENRQQLIEQAIRLEYMSLRYVAKAYVGELHTLPEKGYFDQNLTTLAKDITHTLSQNSDLPSLHKAVRHWQFIRSRYEDHSTELTPYIVSRNSRRISTLMIDATREEIAH